MPSPQPHRTISSFGDRQEQYREVWAHFGLTVYESQMFEAGIVGLIAIHETTLGNLPGSEEEIYNDFDKLWRQTLGRLLTDLKSRDFINSQAVDIFDKALGARNHLIHRYWRFRVDKLASAEGMQEIVDELLEKRYILRQARTTANDLSRRYLLGLNVMKEEICRLYPAAKAALSSTEDRLEIDPRRMLGKE